MEGQENDRSCCCLSRREVAGLSMFLGSAYRGGTIGSSACVVCWHWH